MFNLLDPSFPMVQNWLWLGKISTQPSPVVLVLLLCPRVNPLYSAANSPNAGGDKD